MYICNYIYVYIYIYIFFFALFSFDFPMQFQSCISENFHECFLCDFSFYSKTWGSPLCLGKSEVFGWVVTGRIATGLA